MKRQEQDKYVDAKTFAQDYSLSVRTFFHWIREGKLTPYRLGKRKTLVKRADVVRLIESLAQPGTPMSK